jgi:FkbM family methyltransferase
VIPRIVDRILSDAPGSAGAYYNAYKTYRWGDPYLRLIRSLTDPSRLSIDVGAHRGDYTFFMRRYSAGCMAFECNPTLVHHLRRRFGRSVDIRSDAVSDQEGTAVLRVPQAPDGLGRATIEDTNALHGFTRMDVVNVNMVRLDDVVDRPVGFIKIDVEGHEMAVLRGALDILRRDKPNLVLELEERHAQGCLISAFDFLADLGYGGSYIKDGALVSFRPTNASGEGFGNYVFKHGS